MNNKIFLILLSMFCFSFSVPCFAEKSIFDSYKKSAVSTYNDSVNYLKNLVKTNNPVTIAHAQQIAKYGEIQHKGLIKSWVEHILDWTHELQGGVSDAWEILKEEGKGGGDYDLYDPRPESDAPATNRAAVIAQATEPEPPQAKGFWRRLIGKSTAPDSQQETTPQQENENTITPKDPASPIDDRPKPAESYDHDRDPWAQLTGETKADFQRGKFTKAIESDKTPDKDHDNDRER